MPALLPYGENIINLSYAEAREFVFRYSSMEFNLGNIIAENEDLALCNDQAEFEVLPGIFLEITAGRCGLLSRLRRRNLTDDTRVSVTVRNRRWHCSQSRHIGNTVGGRDSFTYASSTQLQSIVASSVSIQDHCGGHCYARTLLDHSSLTDESLSSSSPVSQAGAASCTFRLISYSEAIESLLYVGKLRLICKNDPSQYCAELWKSLRNGTVAYSDLFPVHVSHNSATGATYVVDGNHRLCCTRVFGGKIGKIDAIVDTCCTPNVTDFGGHTGVDGCFSSDRFRVSSKKVMKQYYQLLHKLHLSDDEGHELLNIPFDGLFSWIDRLLR